ncbi:hypothetical protein GPALN_015004 [Globodera pallida]|nr:hypothetical protein GPALN_015004 [Globodera pallida]
MSNAIALNISDEQQIRRRHLPLELQCESPVHCAKLKTNEAKRHPQMQRVGALLIGSTDAIPFSYGVAPEAQREAQNALLQQLYQLLVMQVRELEVTVDALKAHLEIWK